MFYLVLEPNLISVNAPGGKRLDHLTQSGEHGSGHGCQNIRLCVGESSRITSCIDGICAHQTELMTPDSSLPVYLLKSDLVFRTMMNIENESKVKIIYLPKSSAVTFSFCPWHDGLGVAKCTISTRRRQVPVVLSRTVPVLITSGKARAKEKICLLLSDKVRSKKKT